MYLRRHVEIWLAIRSQVKLVQNPLSITAATATRATAAARAASDATATAIATATATSAATLPTGYSHVAPTIATATESNKLAHPWYAW